MFFSLIRVSSVVLLTILFVSGCIDQDRETRLAQRESLLQEREHEFALKEADYQSLLRMRDSILASQTDTVMQEYWPAEVIGLWNSKVVCVESDCTSYVIGDVRSDQWEFGYDSTRLVSKVHSNDHLVRIYQGSYRDSTIGLVFATDSAAAKQVLMRITINEIGPDKMRGTRTVMVDKSCTAKFSVELTKNKNNPE